MTNIIEIQINDDKKIIFLLYNIGDKCVYFATCKINKKTEMDKMDFKPLSEKEMSQIIGGKWVEINGKFYWLPAVTEEAKDKYVKLLGE